jgi:hypothetical protein
MSNSPDYRYLPDPGNVNKVWFHSPEIEKHVVFYGRYIEYGE